MQMDWGLLTLALIGAGFVWARVAQARRDEAHQEQGRDEYRRRIVQDPKNSGAHEALGDSLRASGQFQEAQAAYTDAVASAGEGVSSERIQYKLRQIDLDIHEHEAHKSGHAAKSAPDLFFCRQCGGANPPLRRVCETCGATLPHDRFGDALRDKEVLRASAESAACVLVLFAALAVADAQPLEVKGVLIISTVIVVAWRFLQAIGGSRG